jgi:hypothetical protein
MAAVAQTLEPGDPHFKFLYWARQLFEHDAFRIQQLACPHGYLFWVSEVYDKSPPAPPERGWSDRRHRLRSRAGERPRRVWGHRTRSAVIWA